MGFAFAMCDFRPETWAEDSDGMPMWPGFTMLTVDVV